MPRIMSIDYGLKRVGIATTDPLQIIASPLQGVDEPKVLDFLSAYIQTEAVEAFVVGEPTRWDGSPSEITPRVEAFIKKLKARFPTIPVFRVDESYTTKEAMSAMIQGGANRKKRQDKKVLDAVAAALILQRFLDSR